MVLLAVLCPACGGGEAGGRPGASGAGTGVAAGGGAAGGGGVVPTAEPVVRTTGGEVRGVTEGPVVSFFGLPYAAPPVGALRWRPPAQAAPWNGVRDGSVRGRPCPQEGPLAGAASEDCLFVNVSMPAGAPRATGTGLPVLVWIHGGGFVTGSANEADLSALAAGGPALLVGVNYRLGALGQLALPALNAESGGDAGSYSLADLIAALRWVRANAAAFGGDQNNVTIFGESAGSVNVCGLLAAPSAHGLFQRAVMQSGPCQWPLPTMATAEGTGQQFAARMGCADPAGVLDCLRARPVEQIVGGSGQSDILTAPTWAPVVGSRTLPRPPVDAVAAGSAAGVSVLLGTVRDEGRAFTASYDSGGELTDERFAQIVRAEIPDRADAVLAAYPPGVVPARERLAQVITDRVFACPTAHSADLFSQPSGQPGAGSGSGSGPGGVGPGRTFLYEFDVPGLGPVTDGVATGATHAGELPYLFRSAASDAPRPGATAGERALSAAMVDYWTRFAATGDPNTPPAGAVGMGSGERVLPAWPPWPGEWNSTVPDRLALEPGVLVARSGYAAAHHCDIWG
ncbi:carboxylesterase/lipase family protein [Parafrankia discariae]|uniref:carboxylesterase/lipase family protein n=1 Tax=Parafrankia discariae TaxID=365528 RepID=UPI000365408C|nr:carboxylesterase family protein [Parafrankia discariae]